MGQNFECTNFYFKKSQTHVSLKSRKKIRHRFQGFTLVKLFKRKILFFSCQNFEMCSYIVNSINTIQTDIIRVHMMVLLLNVISVMRSYLNKDNFKRQNFIQH